MKSLITLTQTDLYVPVDLVSAAVCGGGEEGFTCSLSVSARRLDPDGFVVEVHHLADRILERFAPENGKRKASCEELAQGVLRVILEEVQNGTGFAPEAASVEVINFTGSVSVDYADGDEWPSFPRLARASEIAADSEEDDEAHEASEKVNTSDRYIQKWDACLGRNVDVPNPNYVPPVLSKTMRDPEPEDKPRAC